MHPLYGIGGALSIWLYRAISGLYPNNSHLPKKRLPLRGGLFFWYEDGTRKPGPSKARVPNSPVDCLVGRGRVPPNQDAFRGNVD